MATPVPCPRCSSPRLAVIYYDADGKPLGGHHECAECGPRHAVKLVPLPRPAVRRQLLERKAS